MADFPVPDLRWPRNSEPIRTGARRPYLRLNVSQGGAPIDFTDPGLTITFTSYQLSTTVVAINASAAVGGNGYLEYRWGSTDTTTAGDYSGYFSVTDGTGTRADYPRGNRIVYQIVSPT